MKTKKTLILGMLFAACISRAEEQKVCFELKFKKPEALSFAQGTKYYESNKKLKVLTFGEIVSDAKVYCLKDVRSKGFVDDVKKGGDPYAVAIAVGTIVFNEKDNIRALQAAYTVPRYKDESQIDRALFLCEKFRMELVSSKVLFSQSFDWNGMRSMNVLVETQSRRSPPGSINVAEDVTTYFLVSLVKKGDSWRTTFAEDNHGAGYRSIESLLELAEHERGSLRLRAAEKNEGTEVKELN